jgi:RHS repeat-associated protein
VTGHQGDPREVLRVGPKDARREAHHVRQWEPAEENRGGAVCRRNGVLCRTAQRSCAVLPRQNRRGRSARRLWPWNGRGDLLSEGTQEYHWDAAGRLVGVDGAGGLDVLYWYDGAGNRVAAEVDGVKTQYAVDRFNPVDVVPQVLVEETAGEGVRYLYGLDLLGDVQGSTTRYYGYDALSVRLHLDESGDVTAQYRYTPFGQPMGEGPPGYGFTGERWDGYIKMLFLRARYYQPAVGRFVSRDCWAGRSELPQSLDRWVYVRNQP